MNYDEWKANDSLWFHPEQDEAEGLTMRKVLIRMKEGPTQPMKSQLAAAINADYVKVPVIEKQTESGEHTPRYPVHCKKCGFAGDAVQWPGSLGLLRRFAQRAVYNLAVKCPDCKKDLDGIEITVIFNSQSNWFIGKKHVG